MTPQSILVLFAHPAFQRSRVNAALAAAARSIDGVTFHDLYEEYPDLIIDEKREQALAESHSIMIWQHPFYWYSTPPILKEWQDLVLAHGWAYGNDGNSLRGKTLLNVISTGGSEGSYCRPGSNQFTMLELLAPIQQTARLCGMRFLPPFVVHGSHQQPDSDLEKHAQDYAQLLQALRDDTIDLERARSEPRINHDLTRLMRGSG